MTIDRADLDPFLERIRVGLNEDRARGWSLPVLTPDQQRAQNIQRLYAIAGAPQRKDALWAFAFDVLVWWHQAGKKFYGKGAGDGGTDGLGATYQRDDGLAGLARDAVFVLGGWRVARALLQTVESGALYRMPSGHKAADGGPSTILRGIIVRPRANPTDTE